MEAERASVPIAQFFNINTETRIITCLLCQVDVAEIKSTGGSECASTMRAHIDIVHEGEIYDRAESSPDLVRPVAPTQNVNTLTKVSIFRTQVQKPQDIHYLIGTILAVQNWPLSVLQKTTVLLQNVIRHIPDYKLPRAAFFRHMIIPDIIRKVFTKLKRSYCSAPAMSITSQFWKCPESKKNLSIFNAHWLTEDFELGRAMLGIETLPDGNNKETIAKGFNIVVGRWRIEHSQIHMFVHDSSTSIRKGIDVECDSSRCFIETLQEVVIKSLKVQPEIEKAINKGRIIVRQIIHSESPSDEIPLIQRHLNLPNNDFEEDICTRWISTYYMVERLVQQKPVILLNPTKANDRPIANISDEQWCLLEEYLKLLKPFEEIIKYTSARLTCISHVLPIATMLIVYLDQENIKQRTGKLSPVRTSLIEELEKSFSPLGKDLKYLIATYLDPRFKANNLTLLQAEEARHNIILESLKMTFEVSSNGVHSTRNAFKQNKRNETQEHYSSFWDCYAKFDDEGAAKPSPSWEIHAIESEINFYLKMDRLSRDGNPYRWWAENKNQFPYLAKLARTYLSAPGCCVFNEKLYSKIGLDYENKLQGYTTNIETIVFLHLNLPLVNYKY